MIKSEVLKGLAAVGELVSKARRSVNEVYASKISAAALIQTGIVREELEEITTILGHLNELVAEPARMSWNPETQRIRGEVAASAIQPLLQSCLSDLQFYKFNPPYHLVQASDPPPAAATDRLTPEKLKALVDLSVRIADMVVERMENIEP